MEPSELIVCRDAVNLSGFRQLFQLPVDRGQAHLTAVLAQLVRQLGGGDRRFAVVFQALENGLLLSCTV